MLKTGWVLDSSSNARRVARGLIAPFFAILVVGCAQVKPPVQAATSNIPDSDPYSGDAGYQNFLDDALFVFPAALGIEDVSQANNLSVCLLDAPYRRQVDRFLDLSDIQYVAVIGQTERQLFEFFSEGRCNTLIIGKRGDFSRFQDFVAERSDMDIVDQTIIALRD